VTPERVEPAARPGLVDRYEQMRAAALGGGADGWRLGLGVLAGKGVAGWIRAASTCTKPVPEPPSAASGSRAGPSGPSGPSGPQAMELVRVLAAMTLAHA